jgi:hypothetical protein
MRGEGENGKGVMREVLARGMHARRGGTGDWKSSWMSPATCHHDTLRPRSERTDARGNANAGILSTETQFCLLDGCACYAEFSVTQMSPKR